MVFAKKQKHDIEIFDEKIKKLKNKNFSAKDISIILSELYGAGKNEIYKRVLDI